MTCRILKVARLLLILSSAQAGAADVWTCSGVSLAGPGNGVPYKGTIRNSDYRFTARIPIGLTGWGAGSSAPFTGFIVYLSNQEGRAACINFEIHV